MGKRTYFPAFFSYSETLEDLTDDQVGRVFRAALRYADTGEEMDLSGAEKVAFKFIRRDIDKSNAEYNARAESNAQNGQKGGRPQKAKETEENPKKPNETQENPTENLGLSEKPKKPKEKEKEKEKENIPVSNETVYGAPKAAPTAPAPKMKIPPDVEEVREYIAQMGYTVDAERFMAYYAAQGWKLSNGLPMKDWKACLKTWSLRYMENPPRAAPVSKHGDPLMDYLDKVIAGEA